jgi:[histone H3]-lysine36 N-dimethyltransferase SETMAR
MKDRMEISMKLLDTYSNEFVAKLVTGDQMWIHYYDPESKRASMKWMPSDSKSPKRLRAKSSSSKIMITIFWDAEGVLLIDYKDHTQSYTDDYHAFILKRLHEKIKNKRRGKLSKGVIILQDNSRPHTSRVSMAVIHECRFELIPHPPYSPDLAPSDYYLFGHLKNFLRGKVFNNDNEGKLAVES